MSAGPFAYYGRLSELDRPLDVIDRAKEGVQLVQALVRGLDEGVELGKGEIAGLDNLLYGLVETLETAAAMVGELQAKEGNHGNLEQAEEHASCGEGAARARR